MTDIKTLLGRKRLNGEDLGRIEVTNMAVLFRRALEGEQDPEPIISTERFRILLSTLTDAKQLEIYNAYIAIHDWLTAKYNISQTHMQQAQLQLRSLWDYLSEIILTEEFFTYFEKIDAPNKPPIPDMITANSISYFYPDAPDFASTRDLVLSARQVFMGSFYLLTHYNLALELIAEAYGLPDILVFQCNITCIHTHIKNYNELYHDLYGKIKNGEYFSTPEDKIRKLETLESYFYPVDVHDIQLPPERLAKAKALLKDFQAFAPQQEDLFFTLLCTS